MTGKPTAYRVEPQINDASYGLMQLLERTARGLGFIGDVSELYIPKINIDLGTKLLADLRKRYGDDFRRIYSAYNSGRPDLYLTSAQVAKNVSRAIASLERYVMEEIQYLTGSVKESPVSSATTAIIVFVLLAFWIGKRR